MPFGLKNAPATFQRLMNLVLMGLQDSELLVYLDDVIIFASDLEEHAKKVKRLFERLKAAKLSLQPDKSEFLATEVEYLGHIIDENGVRPDPKKTEAVRNFPKPKNQTNIRQFLGLAGYYRRFIEGFSSRARAFPDLLKKTVVFEWTEKHEQSFEDLKNALCIAPVLQHPDFEKPFILTTDASDYAVGAVLSQGKVGEYRPIAYMSKMMKPAERNYGTTEKECLAIIYAILHYRPYLYGREFTLICDHEPLKWIDSVKPPVQRLLRWRTRLREYEYKFIHKPGRLNVNADALSRNPTLPEAVALLTSSSARTSIKPDARKATSSGRGRPVGAKNKPPAPNLSVTNTEGKTIAERVLARRNKQPNITTTKVPTKTAAKTNNAPQSKGIRPSDFKKKVTSRDDSGSSTDEAPAPRQRNSGFRSLISQAPPILRRQNTEDNTADPSATQNGPSNKNLKEITLPDTSDEEYWWDSRSGDCRLRPT